MFVFRPFSGSLKGFCMLFCRSNVKLNIGSSLEDMCGLLPHIVKEYWQTGSGKATELPYKVHFIIQRSVPGIRKHTCMVAEKQVWTQNGLARICGFDPINLWTQ